MNGEPPPWDDYVDASAKALGVLHAIKRKEAARANVETIFKMAALIESFELPDAIEPAPIFEA